MVKIEEYFQIGDYTIKDGLISTDGNVRLIKEIKELLVQFGHIGGYFDCYDNKLTSLEGSPKSVGGYFVCHNNKLVSLDGAPQSVGGYFDCANNKLTSLEGAPKEVGGVFYLTWSKDLPLLRLVRYQNVRIFNNDQVNDIINKYSNHKSLKEAILLCQKELIDNGFVGNASW
jgi:hypothetical protein